MSWLRSWLKSHFNLYDVTDLVVGGHCGLCGNWVEGVIVEKHWSWTMCEKCKEG